MRPERRERRSFPRPPLWLNLLLLIIATAAFAYGRQEREAIDRRMANLFRPAHAGSSVELDRIREELSQLDLDRTQLAHQLEARLQYAQSVNSEEFYIAIDTARSKFYFRLGGDVVREANAVFGEAKTIKSAGGKKWTFVPVKGAFTVAGKETDYRWRVPEWVYAMRNERAPEERPSIANGLGKYVIVLQDNYIIHSPPPEGSPIAGTAKPGSIMIPEADLAAIWPRITKQTRVYIF